MTFQANKKTRAFHTQVNNAAYSNYNSVILDMDVVSVVGMNVEINSGKIFFQGNMVEILSHNTLTISNGDVSYPRIDIIVYDGVDISVIEGLPEAYPYPADYNPASYVVLHQVYVEANETSLVVGDITDLRVLTAEFSQQSLGRYVEPNITSQTSVVIQHNLNDSMPGVFAYDSSNNSMVVPQSVVIDSVNQLTVSFSPAFSGDISVIGGDYTGSGGGSGSTLVVQEIDGAPYVTDVNRIKVSNASLTDDGSGVVTLEVANTYMHTQSTSLTSWVINHNLGQQLVSVQCYDDTGAWVQPNSIQLNDSNTCTVTFLSSTAGQAIVKK